MHCGALAVLESVMHSLPCDAGHVLRCVLHCKGVWCAMLHVALRVAFQGARCNGRAGFTAPLCLAAAAELEELGRALAVVVVEDKVGLGRVEVVPARVLTVPCRILEY